MLQDERGRARLSHQQLGENFEAQSSTSYGGELGASFEEHNSSREEWIKEQHRGRRMLIWSGVLIVALIAALAIYFGTQPKKGSGGTSGQTASGGGGRGGRRGGGGPATITTTQVTTGNMNIYDNALGTVTPLNTITIYSQITGRVISVHYKEGQIVRKGQPLIDIDPEPYKATLTQAQGTLKHDEAVLAEAQMDLKRYQDAFARNAIARQQLEDQEKVVLQAEGTVVTDKGTVAYDEVQLSYCHIVSPITGRVGLRLVDPGNTVFSGTGSTLAVITELQPITVVFNVSEDDLPEVQEQLKGNRTLTVEAFDRANDKQIAVGKLTSLDNQIDTTTGTLKLRATFANNDLALFPNQFVNARLLVRTLIDTALVPSGAVQHNGTDAFVYILKQEQEKKRGGPGAPASGNPGPSSPGGMVTVVNVQGVQVLASDEKNTAVSGVQGGQEVATSGFDRLESGTRVIVQKPGEQPGGNGGAHGGHGGGHRNGNQNTNSNSPSGAKTP